MADSISHGLCAWSLVLVKDIAKQNHPGIGRILDPDWVDVDMAKEWKHDCLKLHGKSCDNPMKIWHTRPAWLIDVRQRCLVPGQVPENYVALSYTYGNHRAKHIDADMLASLQKPLALDAPEFAQIVPPIIQQAVYLTSIIGEQYLWVDALCIPHYNSEVTTEQLEMMGAIYATAIVTIIAADGDANSGLEGFRGVSTTRSLDQEVIPFGDEQLIVRNTGRVDMDQGLPYYDRGWTYQEYKMSPRRILFNNQEVHWECSCSVWHEELVHLAEVDKYVDPRLNIILAGFPDLGSLGHIIGSYNNRTLRHEEDALPGISGLLSVLSRSFLGGFLYGIPTMFFDRLLGWHPQWSHTNLHRRVASKRPAKDRLSPSGLPSWSWIGWQGLVACGQFEAVHINPISSRTEETIPITDWYAGHSPQTPPPERRIIKPIWFENREIYKDVTKPLPRGWTRHDAPTTVIHDMPFLYPDGCEHYIFSHGAIPSKPNRNYTWYYPFPIKEIQESRLPSMPEQMEYLFCETTRTWLWGHQSGDYNIVNLLNSQKIVIGSLHLHNEESLVRFPRDTNKGEAGLLVELVAIYESRIYSRTWNEQKKRYTLPLSRHNECVVLWIEWIDGVAYRKASGKVAADEWASLEQEKVSLILG
ncbi:hypothetical protein JX266_000870 [Neoarthrinium moseri]|nr:hypothetical protein JX266_000870 [Neoarthrinium moseri]